MKNLFCIVRSDARTNPERISVNNSITIEMTWKDGKKARELCTIYAVWDNILQQPVLNIVCDKKVQQKYVREVDGKTVSIGR
jgi:hypothetical protein